MLLEVNDNSFLSNDVPIYYKGYLLIKGQFCLSHRRDYCYKCDKYIEATSPCFKLKLKSHKDHELNILFCSFDCYEKIVK